MTLGVCSWCVFEEKVNDYCSKCGKPLSGAAKRAQAHMRQQAKDKGLIL